MSQELETPVKKVSFNTKKVPLDLTETKDFPKILEVLELSLLHAHHGKRPRFPYRHEVESWLRRVQIHALSQPGEKAVAHENEVMLVLMILRGRMLLYEMTKDRKAQYIPPQAIGLEKYKTYIREMAAVMGVQSPLEEDHADTSTQGADSTVPPRTGEDIRPSVETTNPNISGDGGCVEV